MFVFNEAPLKKVVKELEEVYKVHICLLYTSEVVGVTLMADWSQAGLEGEDTYGATAVFYPQNGGVPDVYKRQPVNGRTVINVKMTSDTETLGEVVVTANANQT